MAEIIRLFADNPELVIAFIVTPIGGFILLLIVVWRIIKDVIANSSLKSFTEKLFEIFQEIGQDIKNLHSSISENVQQNKDEFGKLNILINRTATDTIDALGVNTSAIIDLRKSTEALRESSTLHLNEQQQELKELSKNIKDGRKLLLEKSEMQGEKIELIETKVSEILETVKKPILTRDEIKIIVNAVIEELISRNLIQAPPPPPMPAEE